ncbi:DUF3293 domain-containing protein, partial [Nitrolancea hollandica]|uniref:DUF3293 domain-containing protein n=1 Tax=Nitrolancea hollandica TaxID=1206749 RepID=UPI0005907D9D
TPAPTLPRPAAPTRPTPQAAQQLTLTAATPPPAATIETTAKTVTSDQTEAGRQLAASLKQMLTAGTSTRLVSEKLRSAPDEVITAARELADLAIRKGADADQYRIIQSVLRGEERARLAGNAAPKAAATAAGQALATELQQMVGRRAKFDEILTRIQAAPPEALADARKVLSASKNKTAVDLIKAIEAATKTKALNQSVAERVIPRQVDEALRSGDYVALSAERFNLTPEQNAARTQALANELTRLGVEFYPVTGHYGGSVEQSFFVPNLDEATAVRLGQQFEQESVLVGSKGLVYTDGSGRLVPTTGEISINGPEPDFYSEIDVNGTPVKFAVGLDFDNETLAQAANAATTPAPAATARTPVTGLGAPQANAPVREVIDQIAYEHGGTPAQADAVIEILEPIVGQNPEQFQALQLWESAEARRHLEDAFLAKDQNQAREAVSKALEAINQQWASFGIRHPIFHRIFKLLPDNKRAVQGSRVFGAQQYGGSALRDQDVKTIEEALARPEVKKAVAQHQQDVDAISQVVSEINAAHPAAQLSDTATVREVLDAVAKYGTAAQNQTVNEVIKRWNLPTGLEGQGLRTAAGKIQQKNLIDAYEASLRKELKIGEDVYRGSRLIKWLESGTLPRAWREQALLSVRNLTQNGVDIAFKS